MSEPGDPFAQPDSVPSEEVKSTLTSLHREASSRLKECATTLAETTKKLQAAREEQKKFEINPDQTLRVKMGWIEYQNAAKEAKEEVEHFFSELSELQQQYASIQREVGDYERQLSDLGWQLDASAPEKPPEYNPLDTPEERE
ncbi:MAG: hypothetical protein AAB416_04840 [Patescibacteria group bacterium]